MGKINRNYINGAWKPSESGREFEVINPATEDVTAILSLGTQEDVDLAVRAARRAFETYSQTDVKTRMDILSRLIESYKSRMGDLANAITEEMGAPKWLASTAHVGAGLGHLATALEVLKSYEFEEMRGTTHISKEPIGVCGFITPWNWPMNQIGCKLAPALATGCTVVWKPSEQSPISAQILTEVIDQADLPKGVVNMVHGDGPTVGAAIASHGDIDMVSFTGSTRAGVLVAQAAAPTVKRVTQELGGKSANIIMDDLDIDGFSRAVSGGFERMCMNSGQNCNAPSRMLVPRDRVGEAEDILKKTAQRIVPGNPNADENHMGPVVSKRQFDRIQSLIESGQKEGAKLVTGGQGRPETLNRGYFIRPTVFSNVHNDMTIAREEIFGPVLCLMAYDNLEEAIEIANNTVYGLSGYVSGADLDKVRDVARQLRTGMVHLNGTGTDIHAPFGGYKRSGNGREWSKEGFEDYLEIKAVTGVNL